MFSTSNIYDTPFFIVWHFGSILTNINVFLLSARPGKLYSISHNLLNNMGTIQIACLFDISGTDVAINSCVLIVSAEETVVGQTTLRTKALTQHPVSTKTFLEADYEISLVLTSLIITPELFGLERKVMRIGIYSLELKKAIDLAKQIAGLNWAIHVTTMKLDMVRLAINLACDTVFLELSIYDREMDAVIESIRSIYPDYPIILHGESVPQDKYRGDRNIYHLPTPLDLGRLEVILNEISAQKKRPVQCAA